MGKVINSVNACIYGHGFRRQFGDVWALGISIARTNVTVGVYAFAVTKFVYADPAHLGRVFDRLS